MSLAGRITNGHSVTPHMAGVSSNGELICSPLGYDESVFHDMTSINTAYNFYGARPGKQFVITNVVIFADRSISDNSSTEIVVYEATSDSTTTESKVLLQFGMGKLSVLAVPGLRLLVNEGLFVNGKTDDNNVNLTILGYYVDTVI